jgi:hypothetical protein
MKLGLLDQAEAEIREAGDLRGEGELLALAAEIAYYRKDARSIRGLLAGRDLGRLGLSDDLRGLLESWRGVEP